MSRNRPIARTGRMRRGHLLPSRITSPHAQVFDVRRLQTMLVQRFLRGILFTGTFLDAKIVDVNGTEMLEAQVKDQINPQLAALLHLSSTPYVGQLDLKLSSLRSNRWWTCDTVQGGSLVDGNVPEPSSIWLLGSSLLGLGGIRFGRALLARFPLR